MNLYLIKKLLSTQQSINNHVYWVGDSSESEDEREEKWRSILNHIVNIHKHDDNKIFTECLWSSLSILTFIIYSCILQDQLLIKS